MSMKLDLRFTLLLFQALLLSAGAHAQQEKMVLDRGGSTIVIEPYAPNIVRVTLSLQKDQATEGPGFGLVGVPSNEGWSHEHRGDADIFAILATGGEVENPHQARGNLSLA